MNAPAELAKVIASQPDATLGYKDFSLGSFGFRRDEYFAHITWKTRDGRPMSHTMDIGNFLRALMRDVAWGFFYGWVNFDDVFGTVNHYQSVDLFAGSFNGTMKDAGIDLLENFPTAQIRATFEAMLDDWTNESFDPFAAPQETGSPYGRKNGNNTGQDHPGARAGQALRRPEGRPRRCAATQRGAPVNRAFADVPQDEPELHPEPGFENEVHAFNLFGFLSPLAGHLEPELHLGRASTASCARRPRSTSCRSSTATTASSGSSR